MHFQGSGEHFGEYILRTLKDGYNMDCKTLLGIHSLSHGYLTVVWESRFWLGHVEMSEFHFLTEEKVINLSGQD